MLKISEMTIFDESTSKLCSVYMENEVFLNKGTGRVDKNEVIKIIKETRDILFPDYFKTKEKDELSVKSNLYNLNVMLRKQIKIALSNEFSHLTYEQLEEKAREISFKYISSLPTIQMLLLKDLEATYEGDPAATSMEEIIYSYPGFWATMVYRMAHVLYGEVSIIPRIMSEYVHSRTGIDINAGATIGEYFFIDHGTGIVIGETTVIGDHVKIYQGVTLGALSTKDGRSLGKTKRHPTIEDYAVIYSGASILGGDTVVGKGVVVGGNAFVTKSIMSNVRSRAD